MQSREKRRKNVKEIRAHLKVVPNKGHVLGVLLVAKKKMMLMVKGVFWRFSHQILMGKLVFFSSFFSFSFSSSFLPPSSYKLHFFSNSNTLFSLSFSLFRFSSFFVSFSFSLLFPPITPPN